MVVNRAHDFWPDADFWVSKDTDTFNQPSTALTVSGDTWTNEQVDMHIRLNAWDSGKYSVKLAKHLGFENIYVIGMRGSYNLPNNGYDESLTLPHCTTTNERLAMGWREVDATGVHFINSNITTYILR